MTRAPLFLSRPGPPSFSAPAHRGDINESASEHVFRRSGFRTRVESPLRSRSAIVNRFSTCRRINRRHVRGSAPKRRPFEARFDAREVANFNNSLLDTLLIFAPLLTPGRNVVTRHHRRWSQRTPGKIFTAPGHHRKRVHGGPARRGGITRVELPARAAALARRRGTHVEAK